MWPAADAGEKDWLVLGGGWPDADMLLLRSPLDEGRDARWPLMRWEGMEGWKEFREMLVRTRKFEIQTINTIF